MDNVEALFIGKNLICLDEIVSTNDYSIELMSKISPPEGTCVFADYQSGGRGQIGRSWHSSRQQNLLLSYIIYPTHITIDHQYYLNMVVSLAVFDTLKSYGFSPKIKWPNDIYLDDRKVCGILIQNILRGDQIKAAVLGIGLNVNESEFPIHLPNPTSLFLEAKKSYDRLEILSVLNKQLEYNYLLLKAKKLASINELYRSRLYKFGISSQFETGELGRFDASIIDVDALGRLCLTIETGKTMLFRHGEIKYLF